MDIVALFWGNHNSENAASAGGPRLDKPGSAGVPAGELGENLWKSAGETPDRIGARTPTSARSSFNVCVRASWIGVSMTVANVNTRTWASALPGGTRLLKRHSALTPLRRLDGKNPEIPKPQLLAQGPLQERPNVRPSLLHRTGYAGAQRYGGWIGPVTL
jgi:hypothetical protein